MSKSSVGAGGPGGRRFVRPNRARKSERPPGRGGRRAHSAEAGAL